MELTITRRQVREGLKLGLSREGFCLKYGCQPLEFDEHLIRIYGSDQKALKDIFSEMKANEKRHKRCRKQPTKTHPEQVQALADKIVQVREAENEVNTSEVSELDSLKQREEVLSDAIIRLESEHKDFAEKLHGCRKVMRDVKAEVKELQAQLAEKCERFTKTLAEANGYIQQMNDISGKRRPMVEDLVQIRQRIEELKTVNICVYDSGSIAPLDGGEYVLDETGSEELCQRLIEAEFCGELRVKDIKVLARAIMIVDNSGDTKINLLFDRSEVETAYNHYRANS